MVDVVHRTTREYRPSVSTPDYPVEDWIHDPDLSAVAGVPSRYWIITGDTVSEMTQGEKDAVDASIASALKASVISEAKSHYGAWSGVSERELLRALALVMLDEFNNLRTLPALGLGARTPAQLKTAIENKLDTL